MKSSKPYLAAGNLYINEIGEQWERKDEGRQSHTG
jgi:hypothetical protein